MNTIDEDGRLRRRTHSPEFKARVVAACRRPGVSIAAVALANKLNANLLRRWVVDEERTQARKPARVPTRGAELPVPMPSASPGFIALPLEAKPAVSADGQITIELRRGATTIKVDWPVSAAAECTAWLKEVLR